jgi:hypothetical protein
LTLHLAAPAGNCPGFYAYSSLGANSSSGIQLEYPSSKEYPGVFRYLEELFKGYIVPKRSILHQMGIHLQVLRRRVLFAGVLISRYSGVFIFRYSVRVSFFRGVIIFRYLGGLHFFTRQS